MKNDKNNNIDLLFFFMKKVFYSDRNLYFSLTTKRLRNRKYLFLEPGLVTEFQDIESYFRKKFEEDFGTSNRGHKAILDLKVLFERAWAKILGLPMGKLKKQPDESPNIKAEQNKVSKIQNQDIPTLLHYLFNQIKEKKAVLWITIDESMEIDEVITSITNKTKCFFRANYDSDVSIDCNSIYLVLQNFEYIKDIDVLFDEFKRLFPKITIYATEINDIPERTVPPIQEELEEEDPGIKPFPRLMIFAIVSGLVIVLTSLFYIVKNGFPPKEKVIGLVHYSSDIKNDVVDTGFSIEYLDDQGNLLNTQIVPSLQGYTTLSTNVENVHIVRINKDPYSILPNEIEYQKLIDIKTDTIKFFAYQKYVFGDTIRENIVYSFAQYWLKFQVKHKTEVSFICNSLDTIFSPQIAIYDQPTGRKFINKMSGSKNQSGKKADTTSTILDQGIYYLKIRGYQDTKGNFEVLSTQKKILP